MPPAAWERPSRHTLKLLLDGLFVLGRELHWAKRLRSTIRPQHKWPTNLAYPRGCADLALGMLIIILTTRGDCGLPNGTTAVFSISTDFLPQIRR